MSKLMKAASIFVIAGLAVVSCKKGDNEKLTGENESISELMSAKEGSWWLYGSNEDIVTKRVATGIDSFKLENTYDFYQKTDTGTGYVTPEYFGKNGEFFLMLVDIDGSESNYINVIVNKVGAQSGDTWTNTANKTWSSIPFSLKTDGKVLSTGTSYTINGTTFNDVTIVENELKIKPTGSPTYTNCGTIKMWFAKDVGNIKSNYDIDIKIAFTSIYKRRYIDSLLEYHIEP